MELLTGPIGKADPCLRDGDGNQPLHIAASCGHLDVVKVMAEKAGADLSEDCVHCRQFFEGQAPAFLRRSRSSEKGNGPCPVFLFPSTVFCLFAILGGFPIPGSQVRPSRVQTLGANRCPCGYAHIVYCFIPVLLWPRAYSIGWR